MISRQEKEYFLPSTSETSERSGTNHNSDSLLVSNQILELQTVLPQHSAAVCSSRNVNLPHEWVASHPWSAELFAEHAWFDQQINNDAPLHTSTQCTDVINGIKESPGHSFIWDKWNDDSLFEHATSAAFSLPPALMKKKSKKRISNNFPTSFYLQPPYSLSSSSSCSSIFPSRKLFADNFEKFIDSKLFSTISFDERGDDRDHKKSKKMCATVFRPFTVSKKELEDILESRFSDSLVAGVPSPLSPDTDFMEKNNEQLQEQWNWDTKKRPIGNVPPFCTCPHPDFTAAYIKKQNEFSRRHNILNISTKHEEDNKEIYEEVFTPPVLKGSKGEALLCCPEKHCQGLLFVPYSFIEVPLHRDLDSLTELCKRVYLPGDTELYFGRLRHTVIIVTNSAEHEYLCWKALGFAGLQRSALIYDIVKGIFKPFHRPVRLGKNCTVNKEKGEIDRSPTLPLSSPDSAEETEIMNKSIEKKNVPRYRNIRIASFSWARRPLTLQHRETRTIRATEGTAKYWKTALRKLKDNLSEIDDAKKDSTKENVEKFRVITDNDKKDGSEIIMPKSNDHLFTNVESYNKCDDVPSPLSITEEQLLDLTQSDTINKCNKARKIAQ